MNILDVIKTDLQTAVGWVEKEAGVVLTDAEVAADTALKEIWSVAAPILTTGISTEVAAVLAAAKTFLGTITLGEDLATLEARFLSWLETEGNALLPAAQGLGSMLLQALLALAIRAL